MKLFKACIAMAAFAALFVVPSLASASPVLTHPTGTPVPVNTLIEGTNVAHSTTPTQTQFTTSAGTVSCTTSTLTGRVHRNSGTIIEGEITTADFSGTNNVKPHTAHCTGNFVIGEKITVTPSHTSDEDKSLPWCVTANTNDDKFVVKGGKCTEPKPITFVLHGNIKCTYEAAEVVGTYTTHPADAVGTVFKQKATRSAGSSGFCPAEGTLDMAFTLTTDNEKKEPLYIS